jgi:shikimate kinase
MGDDRSILLCGPMGAGKSSVGRALAAQLDWGFVDCDARIEADAGLTVAQIFEREGEAGFRARERAALRDLSASRSVVALGGGAVEAAENREILRGKGRLVWLDARPETLAERVGSGDARPLLAGLDADARVERLRELCERRAAAYACAELRVETDGRTVSELCRMILERLGSRAQAPRPVGR